MDIRATTTPATSYSLKHSVWEEENLYVKKSAQSLQPFRYNIEVRQTQKIHSPSGKFAERAKKTDRHTTTANTRASIVPLRQQYSLSV